MLLLTYDLLYTNEVEFAILYDLNKRKNPEIPYWQYNNYDLESMNDNECRTEFRFEIEHLYNLFDSLQLDEELIFYRRLKVASIKAVCVLLKHLSNQTYNQIVSIHELCSRHQVYIWKCSNYRKLENS